MGGEDLIRGTLTYCTASKKKSAEISASCIKHFKYNFIVLITLLVLHGSEVVLNLNEQDGGKISLVMELNEN